MDYNLNNGGLVLKLEEKFIISDMKSYKTVYGSDTGGMFWFMNYDGSAVILSDQNKNNSIYRMDKEKCSMELLLDKPCYGLFLKEDWLYYINENDRKVYRCQTNGRNETKVIDEQVGKFILEEDRIFYTTPQGIRTCAISGSDRDIVSDAVAAELMLINGKLVYTDKNRQHVLTIMDLDDKTVKTIDDMAPSSMNTDGQYLYCANRLNDRSIYRIDINNESSIRICGESCEYLHIIGSELFFCIDREWYRMSLTGGKYEKVVLDV
ncbi:MAG: DUF5050 domain-containing protein [Clostridiaceae bacterium]|nr:DUF5050 domain-containing protein [Clostridiaceae bacterium]